MKILMILISGFILGAHAQGSVTIQSEVQQYLETFINQVSDELHVIIDASQARAGQFYDGLNSLKSKVDASLNSLGSQGKKAAKKINDEIDKLIKNMEKEFSDRTMRPKVKDSIGYIQSHYLDPIEKYIKSLKSAVDKNKKAMKCWDNNKNVLKAILDSAAAQTNTVIQPVVANLDSQVRAVAKKINDVVARIESEVKTKCGKSSTCVMQYVKVSVLSTSAFS